MQENIKNYLTSIKEFYKRIETLDFEFNESYENLIKEFFESTKVCCSIGDGIFPIIERITVNKRVLKENKNIRINDVNKLKYPPAACVKKYGRSNLKSQSVFYGTFNFMTAIKEMNPDKGDLITVSKWKLKKENDVLITCPIFMKQPKVGGANLEMLNLYNRFIHDLQRFPPPIPELLFEMHKFYADCFAKKIDTNNNQGYIFTALLADKILNHYNNGIVDAIIYPSTQENFRTENIVIKKDSFDNKYLIFETVEKRVIDFSEQGDKYIFELLGKSSKIEDNLILWN